jgi:hypothetical protein
MKEAVTISGNGQTSSTENIANFLYRKVMTKNKENVEIVVQRKSLLEPENIKKWNPLV